MTCGVREKAERIVMRSLVSLLVVAARPYTRTHNDMLTRIPKFDEVVPAEVLSVMRANPNILVETQWTVSDGFKATSCPCCPTSTVCSTAPSWRPAIAASFLDHHMASSAALTSNWYTV